MYFEIMEEMHEPRDFPKIFIINAPVMVGFYVFIVCIGYYYTGTCAPPNFVDSLNQGPALAIASFLLFFHVIVVYLLKSIVLGRFFHKVLTSWHTCAGPGGANRVDEKSTIAHLQYALCALVMLVCGYVFTNLIPFFDDMLGLIGGILGGPISFLLPIAFYLAAKFKDPRGASMLELACRVQWWVWIGIIVTTVFIVLTMFVGTYSTILAIASRFNILGYPFECHPYQPYQQPTNGSCSAQ